MSPTWSMGWWRTPEGICKPDLWGVRWQDSAHYQDTTHHRVALTYTWKDFPKVNHALGNQASEGDGIPRS